MLELCGGWVETLPQELLAAEEEAFDEDDDDDVLVEPVFAEELLLEPLASPLRAFASSGGSDDASDPGTGGVAPLIGGGGLPCIADQFPWGGGLPCAADEFPWGRLLDDGGLGDGVPQVDPAVPCVADEGELPERFEDEAPPVPLEAPVAPEP